MSSIATFVRRAGVKKRLRRQGLLIKGKNTELVRAATQTRYLSVVAATVNATVSTCVEAHHFAAASIGTRNMSFAAALPVCGALRQRVVDLVHIAIGKLWDYPLLLNDRNLVKSLIALENVVLPCCSNCPYTQLTPKEYPSACASAQALGTDDGESQDQ